MSNNVITKKILRIKKGEYLLALTGEGIMTTLDTKKAMDISEWSLEQLGYIISNLKRVGYKKAEIETVKIEKNRDALEEATRRISEVMTEENPIGNKRKKA